MNHIRRVLERERSEARDIVNRERFNAEKAEADAKRHRAMQAWWESAVRDCDAALAALPPEPESVDDTADDAARAA